MSDISELFDAIQRDDLAAVSHLIEGDATLVSARNDAGLTPVMWSTYLGRGRILALLLARAKLDVFEAAMVGRAVRVTECLDAEPALRDAYSVDGFTPLHFGAFFGDEDVVRLLLDRGADANAVARNDSRVAPLHSAAAGRHLRVAGMLIAAGADVDARQQGGFTALHAAAQHGDAELTDVLLKAGADASLRTDDGQAAADIAAANGHAVLAERLRSA